MNEDHADSIAACVAHYAFDSAANPPNFENPQMVSVDKLGITAKVGDRSELMAMAAYTFPVKCCEL